MTGQIRIDGLQFCNWSRSIFEQMRRAGLSAVHATVAYHETFRATVDRLIAWQWRFRHNADLIAPALSGHDIDDAVGRGKTAILFGLQNPLPLEDDIGLLPILHQLGIRFLQLTYNNQSLLGCGWQEAEDTGLTRMGREVIREMNRLGMVIDLSHAGERTALEAIRASTRPVAISHATPAFWRQGGRQVSDRILDALSERDGMLGLSLYPLHLRHEGDTTLAEFCDMAAFTARRIGVRRLGIGSDLCQDQPPEILTWMREGKWMPPSRHASPSPFPPQPGWFQDCRGFDNLDAGLREAGLDADAVDGILGANWRAYLYGALEPMAE